MKSKAFYTLASLPLLLVIFSWVLIQPVHLRLPPVESLADQSMGAAYLAANGSFNDLTAQQVVTPTAGPARPTLAAPPASLPAQERNPGLLAGGLIIVIIIMFGVLRYSGVKEA